MKLILDAGALIGIDRGDRRVIGLIALGRRAGAELVTTAPVVAQAWRDGARQVSLAGALPMIDVRSVGLDDCRQAGQRLAAARQSDAIDALVALLAQPSDQILTSDPTDMKSLLAAAAINATVVTV